MKTRNLSLNSVAACSVLLLVAAGCGRSDKSVQAQVTPTPVAVTPNAAPVAPAPMPAPAPAVRPIVTIPTVAAPQVDEAASWDMIKDDTFDQRAAFLSGAAGLQGKLAGQINALRAKRAAVPSSTDMKDWDFQMNDLLTSQSYLKSTIDEAGRATTDTWQEEKDKVDQAWQKAEDAFDKVRTSTTL